MISRPELVTQLLVDRLRRRNTIVPRILAGRAGVLVFFSRHFHAVRTAVAFRGPAGQQRHGANDGRRDPEQRQENDNHTSRFFASMHRSFG